MILLIMAAGYESYNISIGRQLYYERHLKHAEAWNEMREIL